MTSKTCLRCDWEGDGKGTACPNCGVPLYTVVASATHVEEPASDDRGVPRPEVAGTEPRASDDRSRRPDLSRTRPDTAESPGRPARSVGVLVLVALALTVLAGAWLDSRTRSSRATSSGPVAQPPAGGDAPTPVASPLPTPTPTPSGNPRFVKYAPIAGRIPFSFRVRTSGWESFAEAGSQRGPRKTVSINKSIVGPQGAEAILFWSTFPGGAIAEPCPILSDRVIGPSAAELANAVATAPGTELVGGPSDVTVGGRAAKHVELIVRERRGCDPGFFYTWRDVFGGALWPRTFTGTTIRVWIVDVDGTLLFLEAETSRQASPDLEGEVERIIRSVRFGAPVDA